MLEILSRWVTRAAPVPDNHEQYGGGGLLPLPVTDKGTQAKWKKHDLRPLDMTRTSVTNTGISISAPRLQSPPQSLTGFDDIHEQRLYPFPLPQPQPQPRPVPDPYLPSYSHPHVNPHVHVHAPAQTQVHIQGSSHIGAGRPNLALTGAESGQDVVVDDDEQRSEVPVTLPSALPAVIRMPSQTNIRAHAPIQIGRSVSSPSPSTSHTTNPSSKWNLRLNTSTHSLRLDPHYNPNLNTNMNFSSSRMYNLGPGPSSTDLFGYAYNYPLAKQLSPIAEQDYFSPESLKRSILLPGGRSGSAIGHNTIADSNTDTASPSLSYSHSNAHTNPSPSGSQSSEITRPSPSYSISHPFISRPLNRTTSQTSTSSRTPVSTSSGSGLGKLAANPKSTEPAPTIPPLNLAPPFPGPHPSQNGTGPPLRPRKSTAATMPTIMGSTESNPEAETYIDDDECGGDEDMQSLHAESFVTASDADASDNNSQVLSAFPAPPMGGVEMDIADARLLPENSAAKRDTRTDSPPSVNSTNSQASGPSASESFISRRWNRDHELTRAGTINVALTFRAKPQWNSCTPAFWAFWLGFVCPVLWLIGGWHFTRFGEQPPRMSFWEFYFNVAYLKKRIFICCGKRKRETVGKTGTNENGKGKTKTGVGAGLETDPPPLPRWVTEKQSSDDGRARLHDPKRSLRGISFGYPFVSRPVKLQRTESWGAHVAMRMVEVLEKPNRLFDLLYGVKLKEVRGRPESGRRMIDPWIQRCRYAFCYALIVACVGLCSASTYLIIYNTRQLR